MTASPGSSRQAPGLARPALLAASLFGASLLGTSLGLFDYDGGAALAQSEAPAAEPAPAPLEAPTPLLPFDPSLRQPDVGGVADDAPVVSGIEINPLAERDPDSLGLLDASSGGFGPALWAGSERERIAELMALLPDRYRSAVLRDLARRLLLSRGEAPDGGATASGAPAVATEPDLTLLVLRIDRLAAVGDIEGMARFLEIVPRRYDEEPIARARVETALLSGDVTLGCDELHKGMPLYYSVPYWQKALIACQLVSGEADKAQLGIELLKERGLPGDNDFFALTTALMGAETKLSPALAAQPLPFALLQARGQTLPAGTEEKAGLGVLVAMARSPRTLLPQRTAAAEQAVTVGAMASNELAQLYEQFAPDSPSSLSSIAPDVATTKGRAVSYQRSGRRALAEAQAQAMAQGLDAAWAQETGYAPLASSLDARLRQVPQTAETLPYGGAIGRALYANGRYELANAWLSFVQSAAAGQDDAAAAATALWPYWRLAGGVAAVPGGGVESWEAAQVKSDPKRLSRRSGLLQAMLEALDIAPQEPSSLAGTAPDATSADPAIDRLERVSADGRRGESVLLALTEIGGEPLDNVNPAMLAAVLTALVDVGFEAEARALAIETALAARI